MLKRLLLPAIAGASFTLGLLVGQASAHEPIPADIAQHLEPEVRKILEGGPPPLVVRPVQPDPPVRVPEPPPAQDYAPATPKIDPGANEQAQGPSQTVSSTAYCLTGTMASGKRVYSGAVAMNGPSFGTRYQVLSGPASGRTFTVEDRIGHGSGFDIAMPGNCAGARSYGRHRIQIRRL